MPNFQQADRMESATRQVGALSGSPSAGSEAAERRAGPNPVEQGAGRPLRICLTGYRSAPFSGGQGIYLKYLARALKAAGQQVDVVSGPPYPQLDEDIRLFRIPSLDLYAAPNHVTALRSSHLRSFTDSFEYFSMLTGGFPEPYTFGRRLVKFIRRHGHNYDVIHDNQSLSYGLLQLQREGWPVVSTLHHPITRDREIALANTRDLLGKLLVRRWHGFLFMQKRVLRELHHLVAVSEFSRRDFAAAFGTDMEAAAVVHNGIDTELFRPLPGIKRREQRLIAVASADVPLKGVAYLLQALAALAPGRPELKLTLVGPLKPEGACARLLRELNIEDRVESVAGLSGEELARKYAEATLAVAPSLYEGFGLPVGEAMACNLPVVASDGGALPEIVGKAGLLVPKGDAEALATAIDKLLREPELRARLGEAGRERIHRHFSWRVTAAGMLAFYRRVLNVRARAQPCR